VETTVVALSARDVLLTDTESVVTCIHRKDHRGLKRLLASGARFQNILNNSFQILSALTAATPSAGRVSVLLQSTVTWNQFGSCWTLGLIPICRMPFLAERHVIFFLFA
jgi:hypothetical protein